jgi:hypothetical protein
MLLRSFLPTALFFFGLINYTAAQELQFVSPTLKKNFQGAAPVVQVNYDLLFNKKKNQELKIDSVKSVADEKLLPFSLTKKTASSKNESSTIPRNEKGSFRLSFTIISILSEERSPYSEDNKPVQYDMTKGICVYYTLKGKNKTAVVTGFKELPSVILP